MLLGLVVAVLAVANLAMAVEGRSGAPEARSDDATHSGRHDASDAQAAVWWSTWHWDKSTIVVWPQSTTTAILRAVNGWNNSTDVRHPSSTSHTDVSIWQANYGNIGWRGLASISGVNDSHGKRATHCHARLNTYTGSGYGVPAGRTRAWISEGVLCQEMGHCLGLNHDTTGGCMDTSRLNNGTGSNRASSAEIRLINSRY
jgi:hypothetical protein